MFSIRLAAQSDAQSIVEIDHIAQYDSHRIAFIERACAAANCFVATRGKSSSAVTICHATAKSDKQQGSQK